MSPHLNDFTWCLGCVFFTWWNALSPNVDGENVYIFKMVLDGGAANHHVKLFYMVAHMLHHVEVTLSHLHGDTWESPSKPSLHGV